MSAIRARLDLYDPLGWRERNKRLMWTARAREHSDGGGPACKEHLDLYDGESAVQTSYVGGESTAAAAA